jgi:hypothetical protein
LRWQVRCLVRPARERPSYVGARVGRRYLGKLDRQVGVNGLIGPRGLLASFLRSRAFGIAINPSSPPAQRPGWAPRLGRARRLGRAPRLGGGSSLRPALRCQRRLHSRQRLGNRLIWVVIAGSGARPGNGGATRFVATGHITLGRTPLGRTPLGRTLGIRILLGRDGRALPAVRGIDCRLHPRY